MSTIANSPQASEGQARARQLAATFGGPLLMGLSLGIPSGFLGLLKGAATLPLTIFGTAAVMIPALYISASFAGGAPSAREIFKAATQALRDFGIVLAGLSPTMAFLAATSVDASTPRILSMLIVGAASLIALRAVYVRLVKSLAAPTSLVVVFGLWSLICLGIGLHAFMATLNFVTGA